MLSTTSNLLYALLLLAGFPTAWILAKLCNDEIKAWKKRFIIMAISSLIIAIIIFFTNFEYKLPVIMTLFFAIITLLTIIWKTH